MAGVFTGIGIEIEMRREYGQLYRAPDAFLFTPPAAASPPWCVATSSFYPRSMATSLQWDVALDGWVDLPLG